MEKGLTKHWTPALEAFFDKMLESARSFAARDFVMFIRDWLKYNGRSKQAKRAKAQAGLRLVTATGDDLLETAVFKVCLLGEYTREKAQEELERLKARRAEIQAQGIKISDLEFKELVEDIPEAIGRGLAMQMEQDSPYQQMLPR